MSEMKDKVFEDEFMEVQSGLISLCLELVGNIVDTIYAWCSIENDGQSFNLFVGVDNQIKTLGQLNLNKQLQMKCLNIGTMDLNKIRKICDKYSMPIPNEIRMTYEIKTGKFDAKYHYGELCSGSTDKTSREIFMEWIAELKQVE